MGTPTIVDVTPGTGHTGGGTLVEITGTNFRVPSEPPTEPVPTEEAIPTVRVLFGATEASQVWVWSETQIYVLTPKLDASSRSLVVTANPTTDVLSSAGHALRDGQLVSFSSTRTLFGGVASDSAYYVRDRTANTFKIASSPGGAAIDITNAGTGVHSCATDGATGITLCNLDDDGEPITGESVTVASAFRPVRPNLSSGSHLSKVVRAFLGELRRQVIPNCTWTTKTDYDPTSGDLEIGFLAELPAVVIASVAISENTTAPEPAQREEAMTDPDTVGDFIVYRPADIEDLSGTLIGISDDDDELLSLGQTLLGFFKKNTSLEVSRDVESTALGTIAYRLRKTGNLTVAARAGGNIQYCEVGFRIEAIRLEELPGLPRDSIALVTDGRDAEPIVGVGKTVETILTTNSPLPDEDE